MMVCWFLLENSFSYVDQKVDNPMQTMVTKLVVNDCSPVKWPVNMRVKKELVFKCIEVYIELYALTFTSIPDCYHVTESSVWG